MTLEFDPDWHDLPDAAPEEGATFAALSLAAADRCLTHVEDIESGTVRDRVFLPLYHLADWLTWNWWRLRWEPKRESPDWRLSHCMSSIGKGFAWPPVTFVFDGNVMTVAAKASSGRPTTTIRYLTDALVTVEADAFEAAADRLLHVVIDRLHAAGIQGSELEVDWQELTAERADPAMAQKRMFEALLGGDPGDVPDPVLDSFVVLAAETSEETAIELAAGSTQKSLSFAELEDQARRLGHAADTRNAADLRDFLGLGRDRPPAWRQGVEAARELRRRTGLNGTAISNARLTEMAGVAPGVLEDDRPGPDLAYRIGDAGRGESVVLRSRWQTGRRFELARLMGDRATSAEDERLTPATRSYRFRQKFQRAFAAEFLCPLDTTLDMLDGDFSDEAISTVAHHFSVSDLTVQTLLVNNGYIDRGTLAAYETA